MDIDCHCEPLPLQLLLVCRAIHNETVPILYGQNVLVGEWLPGRELFRSLSLLAQRSIRSLQIFLSWPLGHMRNVPGTSRMHDRPGNEVEELFSIISSVCTLDKLHLTLDWEVLHMPYRGTNTQLLALLPRLKGFAVCLNYKPQQKLNRLSKDMVALVTSDSQVHHGSFPLMKLPTEIRHQVLRFTDLVVKWGTFWSVDGLAVVDGKFAIPLVIKSRSLCCRTCSTSRAICCCPNLVAGFSATCTCSTLPENFLSVSRQFAEDAREVLFRNNRFIFTGHASKTLSFLQKQPPRYVIAHTSNRL